MEEALHGGRVHEAARALGRSEASLLDFSANLNPFGPPEGVLKVLREVGPELIAAYPDTEAPELRRRLGPNSRGPLAVADGDGAAVSPLWANPCAPDDTLVLGHGGAALLFLALRALAPRRVLVPVPCFREQPRAVAACGAEMVTFPMEDLRLDLRNLEAALPGVDALLLTNPHNPTGQLLPKSELLALSRRHPEVSFVLDEAFGDYAPEETLLSEGVQRPRTVILRSLTKFFAMPALRVGYAYADPVTARRMRELQEGWPLGQLDLLAAQAALDDVEYQQRSLDAFGRDAPRFRAALQGLGLRVFPEEVCSAGPFALVKLPEGLSGTSIGEVLARQGILVRTCATWPGLADAYLRLALKGPEAQTVLIQALGAAMEVARHGSIRKGF